jgi:hypothetical protein
MDTVTLTRAQVEELRAIIHNAESPLGNRLQDVSSRLYFALEGAGWAPRAGRAVEGEALSPATVAQPVAYANPVILLPDAAGEEEWTAKVQSHRDDVFRLPLFAQPCASQGCGGAVGKRDANNPLTAWAIELLVAAGHVSREQADEAYRIACETFAHGQENNS